MVVDKPHGGPISQKDNVLIRTANSRYMDVTIFTNFDVSETNWYNMIDESYEITTIQSSEQKWEIDLPRKELKKLKPLIGSSNLTVNLVSDNSITIYAVINKNPVISFRSPNKLFANKVAAEMHDVGVEITTYSCSTNESKIGIQYGGGVDTKVVESIISRLKLKFDVEITSKLEWDDDADFDCFVYFPVPESFRSLDGIDLSFTLHIDSDDVFEDISANGIDGLEIGSVELMDHSIWEKYQPFEIRGPPGFEEDEIGKSLIEIAENYLYENLNVDKEIQTLEVDEEDDLEKIELYLPIQQYRDQLLPSNVGEDNNRYMIHIQSDSEKELDRLKTHFSNLGYLVKTEMTVGESVAQHISRRGKSRGESIEHFDDYISKFETEHDRVLIRNNYLHYSAVRVVLPTKSSNAVKRVSGINSFSINYFDKDTKDKLLPKIRTIGYEKALIKDDYENSSFRIKFGGIEIRQIVLLDSLFREIFDIPESENTIFDRCWNDEDYDVTIRIPKKFNLGASSIDSDSITQWLEMENEDTIQPYIEVEAGESVRIGETVLNMYENRQNNRSPPNADQFSLYCVDQATANTLNIVASNVASGEPCLLEGETATSKTSIILFLAHLIGQPVVRINLNGQTDTGELIGRYVPNDSEDSNVQWIWENGEIIEAMKYGWWVILDEVNLAEPQILERLNSLLENPPVLTATEKSPTIEFGGSAGEPVHPSFRIFATMNPAEYSGRVALSPAYKDRWTGYSYVPLATEMDILHMLNMWVFGKTPPVNVDGVSYVGKGVDIPLSNLNELSETLDVEDFIVRVARSHHTLSILASTENSKGISMSRKERPVFSRRLLTRFMTYIDENVNPELDVSELSRIVRLGLVRYYIRRVHSEEDLSIISETLDGQGMGPNVWNLWTE